MTIGEVAALATGMGVLLNAVATAFSLAQSLRNGRKIEEVHLATNSMKDALVASTDKEAFARGIKAGEASSMQINHRNPPVDIVVPPE
jgi:hypothetical protein